jgi:hypothetical protein
LSLYNFKPNFLAVLGNDEKVIAVESCLHRIADNEVSECFFGMEQASALANVQNIANLHCISEVAKSRQGNP